MNARENLWSPLGPRHDEVGFSTMPSNETTHRRSSEASVADPDKNGAEFRFTIHIRWKTEH